MALFTLAKSSLEVGGLPKKRRPVLLNNWLNLAVVRALPLEEQAVSMLRFGVCFVEPSV